MLMNLDTSCGTCKEGTLILVGRAGRIARRQGADVEVPRDFMIPTCDAALEKAQLMALRVAETVEMDVIADEPMVPEDAA